MLSLKLCIKSSTKSSYKAAVHSKLGQWRKLSLGVFQICAEKGFRNMLGEIVLERFLVQMQQLQLMQSMG